MIVLRLTVKQINDDSITYRFKWADFGIFKQTFKKSRTSAPNSGEANALITEADRIYVLRLTVKQINDDSITYQSRTFAPNPDSENALITESSRWNNYLNVCIVTCYGTSIHNELNVGITVWNMQRHVPILISMPRFGARALGSGGSFLSVYLKVVEFLLVSKSAQLSNKPSKGRENLIWGAVSNVTRSETSANGRKRCWGPREIARSRCGTRPLPLSSYLPLENR